MKYRNFFFAFFISYISLSCGNSDMGDFPNKADYTAGIAGLSDDARAKRLNGDAEQIEKLLESIGDIRIYYSFSFGSGNTGIDIDIEAADSFALPSPDSLLTEFSGLTTLTASQTYALPYSLFQVNTGRQFNYINDSNIRYDINKVYSAGQVIEPKEIGLKQADSLSVTANFSYPTAFHTLEIYRNTGDSLLYKDYTIDISDMEDSSIKIEFPIDMRVLGYQAVSMDGVLMATNGHSNFPVHGLMPKVEKEIKEMVNILRSAAQAGDKETCLARLGEIDSNCFSYVKSLAKLENDYDDLKGKKGIDTDELLKIIKGYLKKYSDILGPRYKCLELSFPQSYSHVLLYVADSEQTVSRSMTAHFTNDEDREYRVFYDYGSDKYGVLDRKGEIVIPATYNYLSLTDNDLYFIEEQEDSKSTSYYLNVAEKKLEKIQEGIVFSKGLNNELAVFYNKDFYEGVLKDNKTEVIPYIYDDIYTNAVNGNILIAEGSKRGRNFFEFYTLDGQKLDIPRIKEIKIEVDNPNILVSTGEGQWGMLNEEGRLSIPIQYYELGFLSNKLLKYSTGKTDGLTYGLIDISGQILANPIYQEVYPLENGLSMVMIHDPDRQYGYIDENGKVVIPVRYSDAHSFYKGYACVSDGNSYSLINAKGEKIVNFPAGTKVFLIYDKDPDASYYETDKGVRYDYKGDIIK